MQLKGPNGKDVLNVAKSLRSDGGRRLAVVGDGDNGDGDNGGAGAWQAACGAPLARLRLFARLPYTRADRGPGSATPEPGLVVWRPALLSRPLERRRLRSVLDPDADRQCVELRPIIGRNCTGPFGARRTQGAPHTRERNGLNRRRRAVLPLFADRDAANSPAIARLHALPNHIANALVAVIGPVSAVAVIGVAETETAAAKAATAETTA